MGRKVGRRAVGAAALGVVAFGLVWSAAVTSREARLAREYLMAAPSIRAKYKSINGLTLSGFRIANPTAYFTYWADTGNGRKFIKVVVDKSAEPWTVEELQ
jgi:hypothetical protein